jgi:NTP pyrophosphatase (non-canonical NTP hydrolase)
MIEIRKEVQTFAKAMEIVLRQNDYKEHWSTFEPETLFAMLQTEVEELKSAFLLNLTPPEIEKECIDVANFCMMIYNVLEMKLENYLIELKQRGNP